MKDPTDDPEVIFAQIGIQLLLVQDFEWLLERSLKLVFAERADLTAEKVYKADKRTLGMLVKELREKAMIDSDANILLSQLLEDRNLFVHRLRHEPWFDTATTAGRNEIWKFFQLFQPRLQHGIMLFTAILLKFGDDVGFDSPLLKTLKKLPFYEELKTSYFPHVGKVAKKA